MNQHGYFEADRIYPAGEAPPLPGTECRCCRYWLLTPEADVGFTRKSGDPVIALQTEAGRVAGYWSPEPHPRLVPYHQASQQDTLF